LKGEFGMKMDLTATIVGGLLKPDEILPFPDQTRVNLTVESIGAQPDSASAWNSLKARLALRPVHGGGERFTRDELHERR
jgi:hypothetical protein